MGSWRPLTLLSSHAARRAAVCWFSATARELARRTCTTGVLLYCPACTLPSAAKFSASFWLKLLTTQARPASRG